MDGRGKSTLKRVYRYRGDQVLFDQYTISDTRQTPVPAIHQIREHLSTMAQIKGRRWYAKKLLEFQRFPNRRVASRMLIQLSRRRIDETRGRIVRTKNILAFSRGSDRWVN
jgi:hypothetical protein